MGGWSNRAGWWVRLGVGMEGEDRLTYVVEVEGFEEVGHVFAAPGGHFFTADVLVAVGCEPFFDEEVLGVVVGVFGEDVASTGPW